MGPDMVTPFIEIIICVTSVASEAALPLWFNICIFPVRGEARAKTWLQLSLYRVAPLFIHTQITVTLDTIKLSMLFPFKQKKYTTCYSANVCLESCAFFHLDKKIKNTQLSIQHFFYKIKTNLQDSK
jgi:hypothetical protein